MIYVRSGETSESRWFFKDSFSVIIAKPLSIWKVALILDKKAGEMMNVLECLGERSQWQKFYEHKAENGNLSKRELNELAQFIETEAYKDIVPGICLNHSFPYPKKIVINKMHAAKKRTVYTFDTNENYVLKFMTYLLHRYDHIFADNLYSFRQGKCVKQAIRHLAYRKNVSRMYTYKVDISDYFNSVNTMRLMPMLEDIFGEEDKDLFEFVKSFLSNEYVIDKGEVISEKKGIMAGTPISTFLANVYLREMDFYFQEKKILYARYSDDIIVFADSEAELNEYIKTIREFLKKYELTINERKECLTKPGEAWNFLGFAYSDGRIDISPVSVEKIKKKMKRKARALLRWKKRKHADPERAVKAFIRTFNKKMYDNPMNNELTWCRWYFPVINTDKSLKIIDQYMQDCIRYIASGKYTKAGYNFRYEQMKALGYRSLVHSYYSDLQEAKDNLAESVRI